MHESLVMHFTSQILNMIDHLHKCQIIHADIKPDNFLLMKMYLFLFLFLYKQLYSVFVFFSDRHQILMFLLYGSLILDVLLT